jgi:uncharacterized membrane protein (DUF373 family)
MQNKQQLIDKVYNGFTKFENIITLFLSIIIGSIIVISLIRIGENFFQLFVTDFFQPQEITFKDYQEIFAKIMTLLISLEFLNSILKVLKSHDIKVLVLDVSLITALAIARKLIIFDYDKHDPLFTLVFGAILLFIGLFYFLVKLSDKKNN